MEQRLEKRKKLAFDKDIISSLPDNIIEEILVRLPFKDVISTSFLSRDWRYKWRSIPDLIFNFNSFPRSKIRGLPNNKSTVDKINQVLLLHVGGIRTFDVYIYKDVSVELSSWLDHLVVACVQKLELRCALNSPHLIPTFLFCCDKLITLNLYGCIMAFPRSFNGFKSFTTLVLNFISISPIDLERLIKGCPLLSDLTVECADVRILKIHAPNLRYLNVSSCFTYLNLNETPMITSAMICNFKTTHCGFTDFLSSLAGVEDLELLEDTIMYLRMDESIKFNRMRKLGLECRLDCIEDTKTVISILKNSHALEYLDICCRVKGEEPFSAIKHFWEVSDIVSFQLNQLKIFNMHLVKETTPEVSFIEFVLGNAPFLEEICITPNNEDDHDVVFDSGFLKQVLSFPRASARARVSFP